VHKPMVHGAHSSGVSANTGSGELSTQDRRPHAYQLNSGKKTHVLDLKYSPENLLETEEEAMPLHALEQMEKQKQMRQLALRMKTTGACCLYMVLEVI